MDTTKSEVNRAFMYLIPMDYRHSRFRSIVDRWVRKIAIGMGARRRRLRAPLVVPLYSDVKCRCIFQGKIAKEWGFLGSVSRLYFCSGVGALKFARLFHISPPAQTRPSSPISTIKSFVLLVDINFSHHATQSQEIIGF